MPGVLINPNKKAIQLLETILCVKYIFEIAEYRPNHFKAKTTDNFNCLICVCEWCILILSI